MKRSMKWGAIAVSALGVLAVGFSAGRARAGGAPLKGALTYAGLLQDAKGAPIAGPEYLEIQFWDHASKTAPADLLCDTGTPTLTPLINGRFSVALPEKCAEAVASNPDVFVAIVLGPSQDEAVSLGVRSKLAAVPYALEASNAERLGGKPASAYQARVADACPAGQSASGVNEDGSIACSALVTAWTDFTPGVVLSSAGFPAMTTGITKSTGKWRRVGDSIEVRTSTVFNTNSADTSVLIWTLPNNLKIPVDYANAIGGSAETWNGTAAAVCIPAGYDGYDNGFAIDCHGAGSLARSDVGLKGSGKVASVGIHFSIPIVGWNLTSP